jgi:hypothetical protein
MVITMAITAVITMATTKAITMVIITGIITAITKGITPVMPTRITVTTIIMGIIIPMEAILRETILKGIIVRVGIIPRIVQTVRRVLPPLLQLPPQRRVAVIVANPT